MTYIKIPVSLKVQENQKDGYDKWFFYGWYTVNGKQLRSAETKIWLNLDLMKSIFQADGLVIEDTKNLYQRENKVLVDIRKWENSDITDNNVIMLSLCGSDLKVIIKICCDYLRTSTNYFSADSYIAVYYYGENFLEFIERGYAIDETKIDPENVRKTKFDATTKTVVEGEFDFFGVTDLKYCGEASMDATTFFVIPYEIHLFSYRNNKEIFFSEEDKIDLCIIQNIAENQFAEQKPRLVEEQEPLLIEEQKPLVGEPKPRVEEQKSLIEAQEPLVEEQKSHVEEQKFLVKEHKVPAKKQEIEKNIFGKFSEKFSEYYNKFKNFLLSNKIITAILGFAGISAIISVIMCKKNLPKTIIPTEVNSGIKAENIFNSRN